MSYIEEARCLKVKYSKHKLNLKVSLYVSTSDTPGLKPVITGGDLENSVSSHRAAESAGVFLTSVVLVLLS